MDPKTQILSYIQKNPGVTSQEINIGFSRSSLGLHLRNLCDKGLIVKTQDGQWQVSDGYIMQSPVHNMSPIDIAAKHIRNMINVPK